MKKALLCGVAVLLSIGLVTGCNTDETKVEVKDVDATSLTLSVDGSSVATTEITVGCGESHIIWSNLIPTTATNTLTWTTSDSSLVDLVVSPNTQSATMTTVYTAENWAEEEVSKSATVTATTDNNLSASLKVNVEKPVGVSDVKTDVTLRVTFRDSEGNSVTLPDYTDDANYSAEEYIGCGQVEAFLGYGYDTGVYAEGAEYSTWEWYGAVEETKLKYASTEEETALGMHYYEVEVPIVTDEDGTPDEGLYAGINYSFEIYVQVPLENTTGVWDWSEDHTLTATVNLGQYTFPDEGGVIELEFDDPSDLVTPFKDSAGNTVDVTIVAKNSNASSESSLTGGIFLSRHSSASPWYESINNGQAMPATSETDYAEYGDYYYTFQDVSKTGELTFRMHYEAVTDNNYYMSGILPSINIESTDENYHLWSYNQDDAGNRQMGLALGWGNRYDYIGLSEIIIVFSFDFNNGGTTWGANRGTTYAPDSVDMTYEITTVTV
ncbi:MAG: hypothetical protein LUC31_01790 [Coprobacillus sp.]|nr:hypothetical protein [Coprobacillus sp.]